ncbi:unnamed protein product [Phytophthora lilii]|uniref:Unnamed protein product n=1 Tax=Phytophthora lilii TaxID=2077276 RepID=A0A9W6TW83_9STRA|nr:unnamed protein product [Phytophthora lilii]
MTSSSVDVASTVDTKNTTPMSLIIDNMQLDEDATAANGAWMFVPLIQETAQIALTAVSYSHNYARTVTSRLCLHYINTIRKRVSRTSITSLLYSVDGCESSEVSELGRCDIWYCRPYTYELQLTQKTAGSDVFTVQSIYKAVDQKSLDELREDSNLDFSTRPEGAVGTEEEAAFQPEETSIEAESVSWQISGEGVQEIPTGGEEAVSWTADTKTNSLELTPQVTPKLQLLRDNSVEMSAGETRKPRSAATIAMAGVATVSMFAIVLVVVLAMLRLHSRQNAAKHSASVAYPSLCGTPKTNENLISSTSGSRTDSCAV